MTRSEQQVFEARMGSLPLAVAFVEAFCAVHGVAQPDALRLILIIEELFTNTVVHGHGGDHQSPVRIEVAIGPTRMALRYED